MDKSSQHAVQESYSGRGEDYDAIRLEQPRGLLLSEFDIALVGRMASHISRDGSVLEVGAGTGRFTLPMLDTGFRIIATDINESLLNSLRDRTAEMSLHDRCEAKIEDIFSLTFSDDQFDFVYSIHVIPRFSCLEDQGQAIQEIARVIKPGGLLLFNYSNRSSLLGALVGRFAPRFKEMEQVLSESGFTVVSRRGKWFLSRGVLNRLPLILGRLLAFVERPLTHVLPSRAWDVFVLARKN